MVANRLKWWFETNRLLNEAQCGYKSKRSTKDCILKIHDDIYKSLANKRCTLAAFLDFEKAYDSVWREGLIYKLSRLGIVGNMLK